MLVLNKQIIEIRDDIFVSTCNLLIVIDDSLLVCAIIDRYFCFNFLCVFHTLCHVRSHNRSHQSAPQDHGRGAVHHAHVALKAATTSIQTLD